MLNCICGVFFIFKKKLSIYALKDLKNKEFKSNIFYTQEVNLIQKRIKTYIDNYIILNENYY